MDRATIKSMAKQQIKGNVFTIFLMSLVMVVIFFLLNLIPYVGSLITSVLVFGFSLSLVMVFLGLTNGVKAKVSDLFKGLSHLWPAFKVYFLMGLFTMLWSLLFYIPGLVKSYSYAMAPYILAENPDIGAREAINRSKKMMDGHKMDLFVLHLSFVGWSFLSVFTLGLLLIWLIPYMGAAQANFYNSIKGTPSVVSGSVSGGASASSGNGGDPLFSAEDMDAINNLSDTF